MIKLWSRRLQNWRNGWLSSQRLSLETQLSVQCLRVRLSNLDKNVFCVTRLGTCQCRQQMRYKADVVPNRHISLVILKCLVNDPTSIIMTKQPDDSSNVLTATSTLVQSRGVQIAIDCICGMICITRLLEHLIIVLAPRTPRLGQVRVNLYCGRERRIGIIRQSQLTQKLALQGEKFCALWYLKVAQICVVDYI